MRLVGADDPDAENAAGILEIDVLRRFPFGIDDLAGQAGLNRYNALAFVYLLSLRGERACFRLVTLGKVMQGRYSHEALRRVRGANGAGRLEEARVVYSQRPASRKPAA